MIVIKKRVSLDFLGEEYKEAYITFQSIPLSERGQIKKDINKALEDKNVDEYGILIKILKDHFIEGGFPGIEKLTADDLDGLDDDAGAKCFNIIMGQDIDPKSEGQLNSPSSTDSQPPKN